MPRLWGLETRLTISIKNETFAVQTLYRKECSTTAFSNMLYDKPWHANHYTYSVYALNGVYMYAHYIKGGIASQWRALR